MKLAWITGAGGLLGSYLVKAAPKLAPAWCVQPITRPVLDLAQFDLVQQKFQADKPALVIHCAALSTSQACHQNPDLARRLNVEVTKFLAGLAHEIPFVFFSTDLVFDGRKGNYVESDAVNPLSVYAETKIAAERIVLKNSKHTVVRTSLNYGHSPTGDRSFNELMLQAWQTGQGFTLFTDEYRCPLPAEVTAQAVWALIEANRPGLYHLAGHERLSRLQIGQLLAKVNFIAPSLIQSSSLANYQGPPRSPDTSLNCGKIQKVLPFTLPGFRAWLVQKGELPS